MAAGANPQMILQMLKSRMAGAGGGAGAPMPGAPGPAPDESTDPATREMAGADSGYALKLINNLKKQIADLLPTLAFKAPAASRALMSSFKGIDTAIKELQQAQATENAVGGPLKLSAAPTPQPAGGTGAPDIVKPASGGM
jgi:hypothetical protein